MKWPNGTWGDAIQVPGSGTLNAGDAKVTSVSCISAGRCAAGGTYTDALGHTQAFVVNQSWGRLMPARRIPLPLVKMKQPQY